MRVKSDLADLEIELGAIRRHGEELVVDSAPGSSIDTRIRVDASEARSILGRMLRSGPVWAFLIRLPFSRLFKTAGTRRKPGPEIPGQGGDALAPVTRDNATWRARRESTGLNKPW